MLVPNHLSLSQHQGRWQSSAPACGRQVLDRLIRASPPLWAYVIDGLPKTPGQAATHIHVSACEKVAASAAAVMASHCPVQLVQDRMLLMRKWRRQLGVLMESPGITQRTEAWYAARQQLTTASDVAAAIGGRNGSNKDYLVKKAGGPEEQRAFSGSAPPLKWGIMFEPVANAIYSKRLGVQIHEFGLLRHPTIPHIGASPDGISDMGIMIEIKCPYSRIIDGTVPAAYVAQIQCQLDVCGLDECDFFECQFDETGESGAMWVEATEPWDGCERGVIVEYWDEEAKCHVYEYGPDMGSDAEAEVRLREAWAASRVAALTAARPPLAGAGTCYIIRRWKLRCMDIVRVQRDEEYVESMNASLGVAWERVLRYRGDREAYRTEVLGARPSATAARASGAAKKQAVILPCMAKDPDPPMQGYAFLDDE